MEEFPAIRGMLLFLLISTILVCQAPMSVVGQNIGLSLSVAPDKLPADGGSYKSLMIQVKGSQVITLAPDDIQVILTSSNETIGKVASQITIPKGTNYVITDIQTTKTAGQTTISAATTGISPVSVTITTVIPTGMPTKLGLYVDPSSIPAEAGLTTQIAVRLEDSRGLPAKAPSNIEVSLSLSELKAGTITADKLTIPSGETLATTTFQATYTPGNVTIRASTRDYLGASAILKTVGSVPTRIAVYDLPQNLNANYDKSGVLLVQLQDANGKPAKAPSDILVALTSSNSERAYPKATVTIRKGDTQALGSLIVASRSSAGAVTVSASAAGYGSGSTTVNLYSGTGPAVSLAVTTPSIKLPSDDKSYTVMAVQLLDSSGRPATVPSGTSVSLSSSNSTVGSVASIGIESQSSYGVAAFDTTYTPGDAIITATASDYTAATTKITTVGSPLGKIYLSMSPSKFYADGTPQSLTVQLQSFDGKPAKAPRSITVSLYSSNLDVGYPDPTVTIHAGNDHADASFYLTNIAGRTNITSTAQGYVGRSLNITTYSPEPRAFALFALPNAVLANGTSYDSIYIQPRDSSGLPAIPWSNVTLHFTSSNPNVGSVDSDITIPTGQVLTITQFHSRTNAGEATISAIAPGFKAVALQVSTKYLTQPVIPEPPPSESYITWITGLLNTIFTNLTYLFVVVVIIAGVVAIIAVRRVSRK